MVLHTILNEYDILSAQNFFPEIESEIISYGYVDYAVQDGLKKPIHISTTDLNVYLKKTLENYGGLF